LGYIDQGGVGVFDEKLSMAWEAQTMPCFLIDSEGKG
jgi:hypothetical protein